MTDTIRPPTTLGDALPKCPRPALLDSVLQSWDVDENVTWCQDPQFDTDVEYRLVRPSKYRERPATQPIDAEGQEKQP